MAVRIRATMGGRRHGQTLPSGRQTTRRLVQGRMKMVRKARGGIDRQSRVRHNVQHDGRMMLQARCKAACFERRALDVQQALYRHQGAPS